MLKTYGKTGGEYAVRTLRSKEYTQREIAAVLGISRSYVSRIEKKAVEKLRAGMECAE